jgi:hypothetical protein
LEAAANSLKVRIKFILTICHGNAYALCVTCYASTFLKDLLRNYNTLEANFFAGMCLGLGSLNFVHRIPEFSIFFEKEVENQKK